MSGIPDYLPRLSSAHNLTLTLALTLVIDTSLLNQSKQTPHSQSYGFPEP